MEQLAPGKRGNNTKKVTKIFLNCPFDDEYLRLLRPLLFLLVFFGFEPLIASQRGDSGELRMKKILQLIKDSDHSIHDISRVKAKKSGDSFRLNMPFELGVDWGYKHYNNFEKQLLVLGGDKYSLTRALSDISGCDPIYHENDAEVLVRKVRNWIVSVYPQRKFSGASNIWDQYNFFYSDLYKDENYSNEDVESMPIPEFITNINNWINKKKK